MKIAVNSNMALHVRRFKAWVVLTLLVLHVLASAALAADPAPSKIIVFGDSLVAGYGLPVDQSFPAQLQKKLGDKVTVINAGVSGDTTSAGLTRLEWTLETLKPDYAIVVLGGNDMLRSVPVAVTAANLEKIMAGFAGRRIPVLLCGMRGFPNVSPQQTAAFEALYPQLAKQYKGTVLYPFFLEGVALDPALNLEDGIHPNEKGIAVIVDKIMPAVQQLLNTQNGK